MNLMSKSRFNISSLLVIMFQTSTIICGHHQKKYVEVTTKEEINEIQEMESCKSHDFNEKFMECRTDNKNIRTNAFSYGYGYNIQCQEKNEDSANLEYRNNINKYLCEIDDAQGKVEKIKAFLSQNEKTYLDIKIFIERQLAPTKTSKNIKMMTVSRDHNEAALNIFKLYLVFLEETLVFLEMIKIFQNANIKRITEFKKRVEKHMKFVENSENKIADCSEDYFAIDSYVEMCHLFVKTFNTISSFKL